MTPLCHLSLEVGMDADSKPYLTGAPCIGSKCSAWCMDDDIDGLGACGLTYDSQLFPDPVVVTTLPPSPTPDAEGER